MISGNLSSNLENRPAVASVGLAGQPLRGPPLRYGPAGDSAACCGSRSNMAGRFLPARPNGPKNQTTKPLHLPGCNLAILLARIPLMPR